MSATLTAADPWLAYAAGSNVDHFADFAAAHCRQVIDDWAGQPLILEPWQRTMMGEALAYDDNGLPCWERIAFVLPRKNGKTTMMAAYGLYTTLVQNGSPEVMLAARTDAQAGRLFEAADMMVMQDQLLKELLHVQGYKGHISRVDKLGYLARFSAESGALDGWNPVLVIADELHAWETPRERKAFGALVSGFGARSRPQFFTITTAGDPATRETSLLGRILDNAKANGEVVTSPGLEVYRHFESGTLVYNYTAPVKSVTDPVEEWKLANPASWITTKRLAKSLASGELTESQKLRYHASVWAADEDDFVSAELWDELCDPDAVEAAFQPGTRASLGIDGSLTYDCTSASTAIMLPDKRIAVRAHVLSCRREAPHHVFCPGSKIDFKVLEQHIKDRLVDYYITSGAFDPRYLQRSADLIEEELGTDNLAPVEPQSTLMRDALACFYRVVKERRLAHDGDKVLRAHVTSAKAAQDERGWVVRKRKQSIPIDALISTVLAVWRAEVDSQTEGAWVMT